MSRSRILKFPRVAVDIAKATARAAEVAAQHADDVDAKARFPQEAFAVIKEQRLLSLMIPRALGGEGATLAQVADVCTQLSKVCAATGMIYAMHQIKLSSLVTHGGDSDWHKDFMLAVAEQQLLLGSATTETGIGGDLRNSICAVEMDDHTARLTKDATVISYGPQSDAILVTARREPASPSSDQVMVVVTKDQYSLEKTTEWNTLGMRGTCSEGFLLKSEFPKEQIFPRPFAEIAAQSMLACAHLFWSSIWLGIAYGAMNRAQTFVKGEVRKSNGAPLLVVQRLAEADNVLHLMRANVTDGFARFEAAQKDETVLNSVGFGAAMLNVKIASSEMVVDIVNRAMLICGIAGYRTDTPFSLGRYLRDAHSAPIMISNNRIYPNLGNMLLVAKLETPLAL